MEKRDQNPEVARFIASVCAAVRLLHDGIAANRKKLAPRLDATGCEELNAAATQVLQQLEVILESVGGPKITAAAVNEALPEEPRRILVVDDSEYARDAVARLVRALDFAVDEAASASEALERVRGTDYALVLMDLQMPEMDGIEATKQIRKDERGRRVPIVALTAVQAWESRDACLEAGMSEYLLKPIRLKELRTMIDRVIGS